jgi:hypothetical protein
MNVNEFDYKDDGGVVYDKDGVKIIHWRQSHTEDGASAYRLDWNGMCVAFTGDGRPNSLTLKYAKGCDLVITEIYPELVAVSSSVSGVMPLIGRITVDQTHNSAYAAAISITRSSRAWLWRLTRPTTATPIRRPLPKSERTGRAHSSSGRPTAVW